MNSEALIVENGGAGFQPTLERLRAAIHDAGMKVFAEIDHAAAAFEVGLSMPPTVVLLYGSPTAGTPVMLAVPSAALELPLRLLVSEGADGRVRISHRPIALVLERGGVDAETAGRLGAAQSRLHEAVRP